MVNASKYLYNIITKNKIKGSINHMNNIPCFEELINGLNNFFVNSSIFFTLESKFEDLGDNFIKNLYKQLLEYLDLSYKNSSKIKILCER